MDAVEEFLTKCISTQLHLGRGCVGELALPGPQAGQHSVGQEHLLTVLHGK